MRDVQEDDWMEESKELQQFSLPGPQAMWSVSRQGQELVEVTGHGNGWHGRGKQGPHMRSLPKHIK